MNVGNDQELCAAIQAKIDESHPPMTAGVVGAGPLAAAMPAWWALAMAFAKKRLGPMASGGVLSGLELAGLEHEVVWDGAENWQELHPR